VGGLVSRNSAQPLTTIVPLDPIWVRFKVSESEYLTYQRREDRDQTRLLPLQMILADGTEHPYPGHIQNTVNQVDPKTGTLSQLPGPEGCISAGGFSGCTSGRALDFPWSVAVSNDAKHVYVASQYSNAVAVLQRDPKTGALTQRPGPEGCIGGSGSPQCTFG